MEPKSTLSLHVDADRSMATEELAIPLRQSRHQSDTRRRIRGTTFECPRRERALTRAHGKTWRRKEGEEVFEATEAFFGYLYSELV